MQATRSKRETARGSSALSAAVTGVNGNDDGLRRAVRQLKEGPARFPEAWQVSSALLGGINLGDRFKEWDDYAARLPAPPLPLRPTQCHSMFQQLALHSREQQLAPGEGDKDE